MKAVNTLLPTLVVGMGCVSALLDMEAIDTAIGIAEKQLPGLADVLGYPDGPADYTAYTDPEGQWVNIRDRTVWTSGMVAGLYWYMFELTGEETWKNIASFFTEGMDGAEFEDDNDLGFQVLNSYGQGLRLTGNEAYKQKIFDAAATLDEIRYQEDIGAFYSWTKPVRRPEWERAVNIDMIMNMEIMLKADELSGESLYTQKAENHAARTWMDLVRDDYSTWHVADYTNFEDDEIDKGTYQGWMDDSTWSRGQAWGSYGYSMFYRLTGKDEYRQYANKLMNYFLQNLPSDMVAFSDFDAPEEGQCKDSSAGAIVASALIDLHMTTGGANSKYLKDAETLLQPLLGEPYLATGAPNGYKSILKKGCQDYGDPETGTITGDYFFLEALMRYKKAVSS